VDGRDSPFGRPGHDDRGIDAGEESRPSHPLA
jgi:hypothetical protein